MDWQEIIDLSEVKQYLRVDSPDDDRLIMTLLDASANLVKDISRASSTANLAGAKTAILYATAYLYEHREEADHQELALTLRALLLGERMEAF